MIISWLTALALLIRRIIIGYYYYGQDIALDLMLSSPLLVAGMLFLLSWQFTTKTGPGDTFNERRDDC